MDLNYNSIGSGRRPRTIDIERLRGRSVEEAISHLGLGIPYYSGEYGVEFLLRDFAERGEIILEMRKRDRLVSRSIYYGALTTINFYSMLRSCIDKLQQYDSFGRSHMYDGFKYPSTAASGMPQPSTTPKTELSKLTSEFKNVYKAQLSMLESIKSQF